MYRGLIKTFLFLLYIKFIQNSPEESFLTSTVKKMCTYRDTICKGEKIAVCTSRIVNNVTEYKKFSSSCYLFLSNICDQPRNEFNIIYQDTCSNYSRRTNDIYAEESNITEPGQRSYESNGIKRSKPTNNIYKDDIDDGVPYENVDEDKSITDVKEMYKSHEEEAKDKGKDNNSDDYNAQVTPMSRITLLADAFPSRSVEDRGRNKYKHTESKGKNCNRSNDAKIRNVLLSLKKYLNAESKSDNSEESESKEKDKTSKHSRHTRDKHLKKYKNKIHRHHRHHHHHHDQHREKSSSEETKFRYKRHIAQEIKSDSHSHSHVRSSRRSIEYQSVNADDNDDKTPEEVSSRDHEYNAGTKEEEMNHKLESKDKGHETEIKIVKGEKKVKDGKEENNFDIEKQGTIEVHKHKYSRRKVTNNTLQNQESASDLENKLQVRDKYVISGSPAESIKSIQRTTEKMSKETKSKDKSAQESNCSESQDEKFSGNKKNNKTQFRTQNTTIKENRKLLKHRKSKEGNQNKDKNMFRDRKENVIDEHYENIDERNRDFDHLNKTKLILFGNLLNKSDDAFLMVGDNITYDAESLYKPLTGNVSTNGPISDKVNISGQTPNSSTTKPHNITTDKSVKYDLKLNYNVSESSKNLTKRIEEVRMKANDNETDQITSYISSENYKERNDKSLEEDKGIENISVSDENRDKSVFDRTTTNYKTSDHSKDKTDNSKDNNEEMTEKSDTASTNMSLDYYNVPSIDLDEKFHHDVMNKLTELNLNADNIDQYNDTDIEDFNKLIDTIDISYNGEHKRERTGTHKDTKTKPKRRFDDELKLTEFIEDSIGRIVTDRNIDEYDDPSLRGNFHRNIELELLDMSDMMLM